MPRKRMLPAVTQFPPPPQPPEPPPPAQQPAPAPPPAYPVAPQPSAADRVRIAWQHRHDSDYIFEFWSAFGWTVLTCGFYSLYIIYQLMRRDRDHIRRRLELLDAATTFAWERSARAEPRRRAHARVRTHRAAARADARGHHGVP